MSVLSQVYREAVAPFGWRTRIVAFVQLFMAFLVATLSTGEPLWRLVGAVFIAVPTILAIVPPLGFEREILAESPHEFVRWRSKTLSIPLRFGLLVLVASFLATLA